MQFARISVMFYSARMPCHNRHGTRCLSVFDSDEHLSFSGLGNLFVVYQRDVLRSLVAQRTVLFAGHQHSSLALLAFRHLKRPQITDLRQLLDADYFMRCHQQHSVMMGMALMACASRGPHVHMTTHTCTWASDLGRSKRSTVNAIKVSVTVCHTYQCAPSIGKSKPPSGRALLSRKVRLSIRHAIPAVQH